MYRIGLELPGFPDVEVLAAFVEAVTISNTLWYLEQWHGGEDPAPSCEAEGILWLPDKPAAESVCIALPYAFARPHVSCHTAAAVWVGYARAEAVRNGAQWNRAKQLHAVELHPLNPDEWHAYARSNGALFDPTADMERKR